MFQSEPASDLRLLTRCSVFACTFFFAITAASFADCGNCVRGPACYGVELNSIVNIVPATDNCETDHCYKPELAPYFLPVTPGGGSPCNPRLPGQTCDVRVGAWVTVPENRERHLVGSRRTATFWFADGNPRSSCDFNCSISQSLSTCGFPGTGLEIPWDAGDTFIQAANFSCENPTGVTRQGTYSILTFGCYDLVDGCRAGSEHKYANIAIPIDPPLLYNSLCRPPRRNGCSEDKCGVCTGPGGAVGVGGDGPSWGDPGSGPGAHLRYLARGVGSFGHPGATAWNETLGRHWVHDYAQRIVPDPDTSHVWLLTTYGGFHEFSNPDASGRYQDVVPGDEYRPLDWDSGAMEWRLLELDGTVHRFDSLGRWQETTDRGQAVGKRATFDAQGRLSRVDFPDGRSEQFAYYSSGSAESLILGKLESITELGVDADNDGQPDDQRTWKYSWAGNDLVRIERPDGTAYRFVYGDARYPGYMTRWLLLEADDGNGSTLRAERVFAAYEYDDAGNVLRAWKGSDQFSSGFERYEFDYVSPVQTVVTITIATDELGVPTTQEVVTYDYERDPASGEIRLLSVSGGCSSCGGSANATYEYDPDHYFLPARIIDGLGSISQFDYTSLGQVSRRVDAINATGYPDLPRETTWTYDAGMPWLVDVQAGPTPVGTPPTREIDFDYGPVLPTGEHDLVAVTIRGQETTFPTGNFDLTTLYLDHNEAGRPRTVDPEDGNAGSTYGTADRTSFTYDPERGHLIVSSRTDPVVGATTFAHDAFNRRTNTTDPSGVSTTYAFDDLDHLVTVTQDGTPTDLVTQYFYNRLGDLFCMKRPRGNGTEYAYDSAGRLKEIRTGTAVAAPSPSSGCLDLAAPRERRFFTRDSYGHVVRENLDREEGGGPPDSWTTHASSAWEFQNRCQANKATLAPGTPEESLTEYEYDCNGNLSKVWDANHPRGSNPETFLYLYDPVARLREVRQRWGGGGSTTISTYFDYDVEDHLKEVVDAEGNSTTFEYSDRDLLTTEDSGTSGTKIRAFDDHGVLIENSDARGIVESRAIDAAGRVTGVSWTDGSLPVSYGYDNGSPSCFLPGRQALISRGIYNITYCYDQFGRLKQDGTITLGYDANGNRDTVNYAPFFFSAIYTFDFADRQSTLYLNDGTGTSYPVVTSASYRSNGPLESLALGNGTSETRTFDARYFADRISVGSAMDWDYSMDAVGNVESIVEPAGTRSFGYQDHQYFLTSAAGPWPGPLNWTYDRVGNRMSETRSSSLETYCYLQNPLTGNTPILDKVVSGASCGTGLLRDYSFDAGGFLDSVTIGSSTYDYRFDGKGVLTALDRSLTSPGLQMRYDGRGYASRIDQLQAGGSAQIIVQPTYTTEGRLMTLVRQEKGVVETRRFLYFADRPVLIWNKVGSGATEMRYVTTDHLGTPALVTSPSGEAIWSGGFEPFGRDWQESAGRDSLGKAKLSLRLPGQWDDFALRNGSGGVPTYYNLNRWYETQSGRYSSADPLLKNPRRAAWRLAVAPNPFLYAKGDPLKYVDLMGLEELAPAEPTKDCNFSRYKDCCGLNVVARFCCKKIVDYGCNAPHPACCESEYFACLKCGDPTDQDYHERATRCLLYKTYCETHMGKAQCP